MVNGIILFGCPNQILDLSMTVEITVSHNLQIEFNLVKSFLNKGIVFYFFHQFVFLMHTHHLYTPWDLKDSNLQKVCIYITHVFLVHTFT